MATASMPRSKPASQLAAASPAAPARARQAELTCRCQQVLPTSVTTPARTAILLGPSPGCFQTGASHPIKTPRATALAMPHPLRPPLGHLHTAVIFRCRCLPASTPPKFLDAKSGAEARRFARYRFSRGGNVIATANEFVIPREIPLATGKFVSDPRCTMQDIDAVIVLARKKDASPTNEHAAPLKKPSSTARVMR